jgi:hypothetical protein
MLIKTSSVDLAERISREIEYQVKRGEKPLYIETSPEAHEAIRILMHAPTGAILTEHDGVPVRINNKFMGTTAFVLHLEGGAATTETMRDKARQAGSPPPSLIIPGGAKS